MKSTIFVYFPGYSMMMILYLVLLVPYARSQGEESLDAGDSGEQSQSRAMGSYENVFGRSLGPADDPFGRSLGARYIGNGMHLKTGWRPVMTSGAPTFIGDAGHKLYSGPAFMENKAYNVPSFGASGFGSTSSRPLNTRDVNKLSSIAQTYKPSIFPQNSVNLNAPVSSYLNPFAITSNAAMNPYKMNSNYHFDNNVYLKQATSHRPLYTKQQQPLLLGLRVKPNQYQITQQHPPGNQFHQQIQYQQQTNVKKPIESYSRPLDNYNHNHHHEGYGKPNDHVNPQESLNKQTQQNKIHPNQGVQAVTYKPPVAARFPQFGINEDSFAPIPSSILGSFSSFGHASVKAREPPQFGSKTQYHTVEPTKTPDVSTVTRDYVSSSTINSEIKHYPKDSKPAPTAHKGGKDDYRDSLVPPPKINIPLSQSYKNPSTERTSPHRDNFIPSPLDPLTRGQGNLDPSKYAGQNGKFPDSQKLPTKRPGVTSFFDSNIISPSTISPYESHTHAVPDNLLVQLPPPHSQFGGPQNNKVNYNKDKHHSFVTQSVTHNAVTTKYSIFDDVQQFPGQDGYRNTNPPKPSYQHSYEVTEGWEPFGDEGTQSSISSWGNPSQTFKQYTSILGPPNGLNKVVSTYYPPQVSTVHPDINEYGDVSTIYSISDGNRHHEFHNAENSLTSPDPQDYENSEQSNKQVVISPSPNYININTERPRVTTTDFYQDTTTTSSILNRRKPSRYRPQHETTTEDFKDVTTRFETYKENVQETENELGTNDLPTIPPNKHFKRPLVTTTTAYPEEDDRLKKKLINKNRRRRPYKSSTTPEETLDDITTESVFKTRTTTLIPDTEETTKIPRNRLRFPQKARPTRPSTQPELTSSAQPTVIPTHPITIRPKLHSRIRTTTQSSLDFVDEVTETTTTKERNHKYHHEKQSSIMKIAKDSTQHRPSVLKFSSSFGAPNDAPDYSHKQDEKDTPTSDVSLHLSSHKYSVQNEDNLSFSDLFLSLDSEIQQSAQDTYITPTTTPQPAEQTESQVTQLTFNEAKNENNKGDEPSNVNDNPNPVENESNKKSKLYGNRPRFSVKDYRNRLNQYTSSTTEKTIQATETSPRLRFPNRSRFANLKDGHDSKTAASDVSNATEAPRKKFVPKEKANESSDKTGPLVSQHKSNSSDNEFLSKANNKFRSSLRKDSNKLIISTTVIPDVTEKAKPASGIKRPSIVRKRLPGQNKAQAETTVEPQTEQPTTTEKVVEKEPVVENVTSTEKSTSETAIMKIAKEDKKHSSTEGPYVDPSQRVSDLTLASSKDYDTPGMFKSVSPNARRVVPNYFTIATDDPILPIEAFFPQLNQKKDA